MTDQKKPEERSYNHLIKDVDQEIESRRSEMCRLVREKDFDGAYEVSEKIQHDKKLRRALVEEMVERAR